METDPLYAALLGAIIGGAAASVGAYLALKNRAHAAERARMATEIMYHVMTAVVLLEEGLVAIEEVLIARDDKKRSRKEVRDMAEELRKRLQNAFAGYDPLRPHIDYRVGKVMRLDAKAMAPRRGLGEDRWQNQRLRRAGHQERRRCQEVRRGAQEGVSTFTHAPSAR